MDFYEPKYSLSDNVSNYPNKMFSIEILLSSANKICWINAYSWWSSQLSRKKGILNGPGYTRQFTVFEVLFSADNHPRFPSYRPPVYKYKKCTRWKETSFESPLEGKNLWNVWQRRLLKPGQYRDTFAAIGWSGIRTCMKNRMCNQWDNWRAPGHELLL